MFIFFILGYNIFISYEKTSGNNLGYSIIGTFRF